MNNEELQQELNLQFPSEIAGIKRPTEPVESKHDFFLKMPQLISKDPVLYNKMNLLFSILLSNDNALKQNIDTILGKLDNDYAQLDSPEFSGIPTVPTPEEQDNSKKITNTEWVQAWGLGNTPNTVFYPIPFARLIFGLVANDVGNGNSAIGCTKSNLNAFFPTATNGNGVGFTYIVIGF